MQSGDADQLIADLTAAGCGFVLDDGELRLSLTGRISTALWARFERLADDDEFLGMAYREAKRATIEPASEMIH